MPVCLPPQYDNDDGSGPHFKDGDTHNVSVREPVVGDGFFLFCHLQMKNSSFVCACVFRNEPQVKT